jgi:hypothetical protein
MKKIEESNDNEKDGKRRAIMKRQRRLVCDVLGQKGL